MLTSFLLDQHLNTYDIDIMVFKPCFLFPRARLGGKHFPKCTLVLGKFETM